MFGGHFDQLIIIDKFHCLLEIELDRWRQKDVFVAAGGTDVGQLFGLHGGDDQIVLSGVYAYHHAFIDVVPRSYE